MAQLDLRNLAPAAYRVTLQTRRAILSNTVVIVR